MIYSKVHQSIIKIANASRPQDDWQAQLRPVIAEFEEDVGKLSIEVARHVRDELCAQIEHEALAASEAHRRTVLFSALKALESTAGGDH